MNRQTHRKNVMTAYTTRLYEVERKKRLNIIIRKLITNREVIQKKHKKHR